MAVSPWDVGNRQLLTPRGTSKITNQTSFRNNQQDATMYQNLLFQRFLLLNMYRATHRSSSGAKKPVFAASGFTYVCGCLPLAGNHMMSDVSLETY